MSADNIEWPGDDAEEVSWEDVSGANPFASTPFADDSSRRGTVAAAAEMSGPDLVGGDSEPSNHWATFDDFTPASEAKQKKGSQFVEEIRGDAGPSAPPSMSTCDIRKKKMTTSRGPRQQGTVDEESIIIPSRDDIEEAAPTTTKSSTFMNRNIYRSSQETNTDQNEPIRDRDRMTSQSSIQHIPEAFLVEENDDEVVIADPILPWYKRKKVVCSLILFAAIVVGVTSGIAVVLTKRSVRANQTISPTISSVPTIERTTSPSSSLAPSASPTECALTILTNKKLLDLPLDKPTRSKVSIEGGNAVVLTQEAETGNVHVIFYRLTSDGWQEGNHFIEDGSLARDTHEEWYGGIDRVRLAFNGKTALVGFPSADDVVQNAGTVLVYEQNDFGVWEKRDEPLLPQDEAGKSSQLYGWSADLDGDLACVLSDGLDVNMDVNPKVYVFQKNGEDWTQIRRLDLPYPPSADECYIVGDTLAVKIHSRLMDVYQYNRGLSGYERIQRIDHRETGELFVSISFNHDHLVYTQDYYNFESEPRCYEPRGTFVYHRLHQDKPFILQQVINSTNYGECKPSSGAGWYDRIRPGTKSHIDNKILVIGEVNETRLFVQQHNNDYWEESLILEESYRSYHVSGRNMMATIYNEAAGKDEVHYFNFEPCEPSPTQMPSTSAAPTSTKVPTPMPSVQATIANTPLNIPLRHTMSPTPDVPQRPTSSPTSSAAPTESSPPSSSPSASSSPTETCYWIEMELSLNWAHPNIDTVTIDDNIVEDVSWDIRRVSEFGDDVLVKNYTGLYYEESRIESLCVEEGLYLFTIHDYISMIRYNISSYGELIAQKSATIDKVSEATVIFSIPLTATPSTTP